MQAQPETSAALVTLPAAKKGVKSQTFVAHIANQSGSGGGLQVGFYLPGDANGDGTVTRKDLSLIKADMGSQFGQAKYSQDADVNRDGKINAHDLTLAKENLGVSTKVQPIFLAQLDPSVPVDPNTPVTTSPNYLVDGTATPGATITLESAQTGQQPVKTVADSTGKFQITGQFSSGLNELPIVMTDGFGQLETAVVPPVRYTPKATSN